jgi:hypothetical protein
MRIVSTIVVATLMFTGGCSGRRLKTIRRVEARRVE